jgi:hypothetical protein
MTSTEIATAQYRVGFKELALDGLNSTNYHIMEELVKIHQFGK